MSEWGQQSVCASVKCALTARQMLAKRAFDLALAVPGIVVVLPMLLVGWILAAVSTRSSGIFVQSRIGLYGKPFPLIKLKTMRDASGVATTVTAKNDIRITRIGRLLRKSKIDEVPQLFNVLAGHMSLVGPRPDVKGFADQLTDGDRILLSVRPGITGPASLHFRDEEATLAAVENPESYNRDVIWPEKVRLNIAYLANYSMWRDIKCLFRTVFG